MALLPQIRPAGPVSNPQQVSEGQIAGQAAAGAFDAIGRAAEDLRVQFQPEMDRLTEERAARDVASAFENRDDPNSAPNIALRRAWSRNGQVYNHAVEAGTMARSQLDLEAEANRLRAQFEFDPAGYEAASEAFLNGYLGGDEGDTNLPASLIAPIELSFRQRFMQDQDRISTETRDRVVQRSQQDLEGRLQQINQSIATGMEQGGAEFAGSDDFQTLTADAANIIGSLVDNPAFTGWSAEAGAETLDGIANSAREGILYSEIDAIYAEGGEIPARILIDERAAEFDLSITERIGLTSRLTGRLNRNLQLDSARSQAATAAHTASVREAEARADNWEARAIAMRLNGDPLPPEFMAEGLQHVASGGGSGSRIQDLLAAPLPNTVRENPAEIARVRDMVRAGAPMDEVESLTLELIRQGRMTDDTRESILTTGTRERDERTQSGLDTIDAYFQQSAFSDWDVNLPILNDESRRDFMDFAEANPEASRRQLENYAVGLVIERGRTVAAPPLVGVPAAPLPGTSSSDIAAWQDEALLDIADSNVSPARRDQLIDDVRNYKTWWDFQTALTRRENTANGQ